MSVFNHKGRLVSIEGEWATYEYYPDYLSHAGEFGLFKVKPASLLSDDSAEYQLVHRLGTVKLWRGRQDEQVVFALMSKIRTSAISGNLFPGEVYHNA